MPRRAPCWLPLFSILLLLAAVPVHGDNSKELRELSIQGTGLALLVPADVVVSKTDQAPLTCPTLVLEVETIQSFPKNGVVTRADVLAQRTALAKGRAKVVDVWEETGLAEAVPLPTGGQAVIYPHYSAFEICDIRFTMNAVFFAGDRRVVMRYSVPPAAIVAENPDFFGHDKDNCGEAAVWKHPEPDDLLKRFHEAAKAGRLGPAANAWYADFTALVASLHQKAPAK
jgi:hypothetical protein